MLGTASIADRRAFAGYDGRVSKAMQRSLEKCRNKKSAAARFEKARLLQRQIKIAGEGFLRLLNPDGVGFLQG